MGNLFSLEDIDEQDLRPESDEMSSAATLANAPRKRNKKRDFVDMDGQEEVETSEDMVDFGSSIATARSKSGGSTRKRKATRSKSKSRSQRSKY